VQASTDRHLWAESYERDLRDVLSLQSDVARAVARAVAATLTPDDGARLASARPVEPAAYEAYLRGIELRSKTTEADIRTGLALFERATTIDPTFAEAHRRVCDTYWVLGFTGWGALPPREAQAHARAACLEALRRDGALGGAHAVLGSMSAFYDYDRRAAEDAFQRALALSPSDTQPLQRYSWLLSVDGRHEEAVAMARRALAADPRSAGPALSLERAVSLAGGTSASVAQLAHAYALAGRRAEAERLHSELLARSKREYVASYWIGLVDHGLGRDAAALARPEQAFVDREALPLLEVEPRWDRLRSSPRFADLVRRVGFRASSADSDGAKARHPTPASDR
jgi:tetratricopeptide (TPR) repeat protein